MTYIADDGLLFRPGAVNGKKWMIEHPVPPSDKRPVLLWQPSYAGMSVSGDMGFTTGPWEAKADIKDEKISGYGHFVTVWKKQADGSWRFVVDLGISHPQSGGPQTLWTPTDTNKKETFKQLPAPPLKSLLVHDQAYEVAAMKQGLVKAFTAYASPDVRLYRADNLPFIGAMHRQQNSQKRQVRLSGLPRRYFAGGDLGYTHGIYEAANERGSYVRIWKKKMVSGAS